MPRGGPILSGHLRSEDEVPRSYEVGMQGRMTIDTTEQQAFSGPVLLAHVATFGAGLRGVVGIDAYDHASTQGSFVGQHGVQFGEAPLRSS